MLEAFDEWELYVGNSRLARLAACDEATTDQGGVPPRAPAGSTVAVSSESATERGSP